MKVQVGRERARHYAIAILLEATYVLVIAGIALLVAVVAEMIVR